MHSAKRLRNIRSIIDHEYNGYLFQNDKAQDLARAMREILTNRQLAEFFSQNARKTIEDRFSLDYVTDEYLGLYESLVS